MNGHDVLAGIKDVDANVPIAGPGHAEKLLEARMRLEGKKKRAEKEDVRKNYQKALKEFGDRYFPENSYYGFDALDEEEKEVLTQIFLKRSKRYVAVNLFLLSASLFAIIYAGGMFFGGWFLGIVLWFWYSLGATVSIYGTKEPVFGVDYHVKFLRAKYMLGKISKKEKLFLESKREEKEENES